MRLLKANDELVKACEIRNVIEHASCARKFFCPYIVWKNFAFLNIYFERKDLDATTIERSVTTAIRMLREGNWYESIF